MNETRRKAGGEKGVRDRILEAAAKVFAEEGFAGARVDAIARRAGTNKALLYYHVGNKGQLYEAVLLGWMEVLFAELRDRVGGQRGAEAKLEALAAAFEDLVRRHEEYPQILVREFTSGGQNLTPPVIAKLLDLFAFEGRILEEGRRAGVFRPASPLTLHLMLVVGTVMHLLARRIVERSAALDLAGAPPVPASPSRATLDLLLNGLKTRRAAARSPLGRPPRKAALPRGGGAKKKIKEGSR